MKEVENTKPRRSQRDYPLGFKLSVVSQVEKGNMTYKQAQNQYGIQGRSTVLVWLRKHGKLDWDKPIERMHMPKSAESPAQKIKRLERELETARIKNVVYEGMVEILEKEHGIDLPKKYFAAQSGVKDKKGK